MALRLTSLPVWQKAAACRREAAALFVGHLRDDGSYSDPSPKAKRLCAGCEVRAQCLETALADPGLKGVWGGTTDKQRSELRTRRKAG